MNAAGKARSALARELLTRAGLRRTTPRAQVLQVILDTARPLSHRDIATSLAVGTGARLDQATVYRVLIDLERAGLLARVDPGDRVWRFELREGVGHTSEGPHPHFVCEACGFTLCLPENAVELHPDPEAPFPLAPAHVTVRLRGLCDRCRARLGAKAPA